MPASATLQSALTDSGGENVKSNPATALRAQLPAVKLPPELASEARGVSIDELDVLHTVYGDNAFASRLRNHPNVAERHYPHLIGTQ
ncbi:hypothetical protein [Brevibacterium sp. HMSC07C04]|uniref:hypothetical protein n=1 Tax=Brevibacterium sp. HMSC07C04 TaxID=1581130 RepID=UPI0008AAE065|nr:hypothetical protein [Brevibacterium sp. HMSC07C04]OFS27097.1 hypothetical protein HMPREF3162_02690 [Brevibacterium sp. HMSC07C04]